MKDFNALEIPTMYVSLLVTEKHLKHFDRPLTYLSTADCVGSLLFSPGTMITILIVNRVLHNIFQKGKNYRCAPNMSRTKAGSPLGGKMLSHGK